MENALLLLLLLLLLPLLLLLFDGGVGVKRDDALAPKYQKGDETNRPNEFERGTGGELLYGCRDHANNVTEGRVSGDGLNCFLNLRGDV